MNNTGSQVIRKSMRVLVVDDSATIRRIIRSELTQGGYRVHEANDGMQALAWIQANPPPDLITLDVEMPSLNGFKTLEKLREPPYARRLLRDDGSSVPIIFVTSNDTLDDRKTGYELGAANFITKPFVKGEVLSVVNQILAPTKCLQGLTALVVDDSPSARVIVSDCLKREGIEVITANDGVEAFEIVCKCMNEIDLAITDLMMPNMDGDVLCQKIRTELNLQNLPIIFLTAVPDLNRLLDIFNAGGTDYLVKPFVMEELIARLTVHLERTQLNKRLKESVKELHSLNAMKDDLLAICSHDLRAPLNGVLGFTDMVLEKDYLEVDDRDALEQVKSSGNFLLGLISDILDLGKIEEGYSQEELEPTSLAELVQFSAEAMKFLADNKKQTIALTNNGPNRIMSLNKNSMVRVVNNLLSNAIKYTPEGGTIEVCVISTSPNHTKLSIADSGIGIPSEQIPHLFDKYTQTSRPGTAGEGSTGLGLSIVKAIVDRCGGRITVDSTVGKGTRFDIILPRRLEHNGDESTEAAPGQNRISGSGQPASNQTNLRPCKILLAEDNPVNIKLAQSILTRRGHTVTLAENGQRAVQIARKETFDIILMDIEMPVLRGCDATRELRKMGAPNTPIIGLTSHTSQKIADECKAAGMDNILIKPFRGEDIDRVLAELYSCQA